MLYIPIFDKNKDQFTTMLSLYILYVCYMVVKLYVLIILN